MGNSPSSFDAAKYKETTRQQWQSAAEAWHRWGPTLSVWLGEATRLMLDLAGVREDSQVLDVAAGAGEQSIVAAHRVGPYGRVVAIDISSNILEFARQAARAENLTNVETRVLDAENLDLPEDSFDAAICRLGLMYFPDREKTLSAMRRVLKPVASAGAIVFSTPDKNPFLSAPISVIRRRANLPPPEPGLPGPFSLGAPGVLEDAFEKADFRMIKVKPVSAPLRMASAAECVQFEKESFGALHQMMAGLDEAERESVWKEIEQELEKFNTPEGFVSPCELLVGVGTK